MEMNMRAKQLALILVALPAVAGCLPIHPRNKAPLAVVDVKMGGMVLDATKPIPWADAPIAVTLDGSRSTDPDGDSLIEYKWIRTDVPASVRNGKPVAGAAGMGDDDVPAFMGDPMSGATTNVMLTEPGKYRFSLWVRDSKKDYSAPTSVTLQVGVPAAAAFMPDAMCLTQYAM